jgi:integrase
VKRRGNGEGSITQLKDSRWQARYTVRTIDGDTKRRVLYGKPRKEAAEKLAKALAEAGRSPVRDAGSMTVDGLLDRGLASAKGTVKDRTFETYERMARLHIRPAIGGVRVSRLSPADVQWFYDSLRAAGLSPNTVRLIHSTVRGTTQYAINMGWLASDPTARVKLPRQKRHAEIRPLTPEQASRFIETARGEPFEAALVGP